MKLIRFGPSGQERPGLQLDDGHAVDASAFGEDSRRSGSSAVAALDRLRDWAVARVACASRG